MSDKSAIEWTDATWNPVTGCTKVSPGCANCYIERTPAFRMTGQRFVKGKIPVVLHPDRLEQPLHWRKPRRVFVVSMGDLFHEDVPDSFLLNAWMTMALSPEHTYQVLTKRPERMRAWVSSLQDLPGEHALFASDMWPLPNIELGVSVENQRMADERIPLLLDTPAAVRFLSCEPLLGPLDPTPWLGWDGCYAGETCPDHPRIDWVIVGGESGPGRAERKLVERCGEPHRIGWTPRPNTLLSTADCADCHGTGWRPKPHALDWLRSLRDQCQAAGVPFFFKQWGGPRPKSGGRLLDGREWNEMPLQRSAVLA